MLPSLESTFLQQQEILPFELFSAKLSLDTAKFKGRIKHKAQLK